MIEFYHRNFIRDVPLYLKYSEFQLEIVKQNMFVLHVIFNRKFESMNYFFQQKIGIFPQEKEVETCPL